MKSLDLLFYIVKISKFSLTFRFCRHPHMTRFATTIVSLSRVQSTTATVIENVVFYCDTTVLTRSHYDMLILYQKYAMSTTQTHLFLLPDSLLLTVKKKFTFSSKFLPIISEGFSKISHSQLPHATIRLVPCYWTSLSNDFYVVC